MVGWFARMGLAVGGYIEGADIVECYLLFIIIFIYYIYE
jgi:hypothetical protein